MRQPRSRERKEAEAAAAKVLAERQATEKALADKLTSQKAAEPAANQASEKRAAEKQSDVAGEQKVAALAPQLTQPTMSPQEIARLVQSELRRVGCLAAAADGDWNKSSQRSLSVFNKYAGTKFDTNLASLGTLDALKAKQGRVCPLVCERGFKADGDSCVKITCRTGYRVNDDNECEKIQDKKPVATREQTQTGRDTERKQQESAPSKPQASGQMLCNQAGCRPVRQGCHIGAGRGPVGPRRR
jgi:hypothetical protein